jgi:endonuclease/exonuclease/phosphatase family metal-dependent hydrolase
MEFRRNCIRVCTYNIRFVFDRWKERRALLFDELARANADVYGLQEVMIGGYFFGQQNEIVSYLANTLRNSDGSKSSWVIHDSPGARVYARTVPILGFLFSGMLATILYDFCAWFNENFVCILLGQYVQYLYHNEFSRAITYISLGTAWIFGSSMVSRTYTLENQNLNEDRDLLKVGGWRAPQYVINRIGGRRIMIVNVHLSSARNEELIRVAEAEAICRWIDSKQGALVSFFSQFAHFTNSIQYFQRIC